MAKRQTRINHTEEWVATETPSLTPPRSDREGDSGAPTAQEVTEAIQAIYREEITPESQPVTMLELTQPELIERVVAQMVSEAKAQDEVGRGAAAARYEQDKAAWNRVFFVIKQLKPLMASSPALRDSKLGVVLDRLPK